MTTESAVLVRAPSLWNRFKQTQFWWSFSRDKTAIISCVILGLLLVAAIGAPLLSSMNPYDLKAFDILDSELPPVWMEQGDERFILGTDAQGRDLLSTILYGLRISISIGIFAVLLQAFLGVIIGLTAGYIGGRIDSLLMRIADIQLSFSTMMVAIVALALFQASFGPELYSQWSMIMLIMVIGIAEWPQYARTVRASVLAEKSKEYVEAAKVMGFGPLRVMFRHILPNTLSPILVISTVQVANAIISEAALSFLGLGMPPDRPSLGSLISSGFEYIVSGNSWWITLIPGIVLIILVLVMNLLGDFLRDVFNPKIYKEG
jgi:peptide/nickel transport system permease protein